MLYGFQQDLEGGEKMRAEGEQYIMDDHYAVDSIRPKCMELQRMCEQYRQLLRQRRDILTKSHDLHERIEKVGDIVKSQDSFLLLFYTQDPSRMLSEHAQHDCYQTHHIDVCRAYGLVVNGVPMFYFCGQGTSSQHNGLNTCKLQYRL